MLYIHPWIHVGKVSTRTNWKYPVMAQSPPTRGRRQPIGMTRISNPPMLQGPTQITASSGPSLTDLRTHEPLPRRLHARVLVSPPPSTSIFLASAHFQQESRSSQTPTAPRVRISCAVDQGGRNRAKPRPDGVRWLGGDRRVPFLVVARDATGR